MVGRYRQKQYQLTAQRHNEELLKLRYYQQIAKYFERECGIAKHYDSWNIRDLESSKHHLEQIKKNQQLLTRRSKLQNLLKTEEEIYRKELEELQRKKRNAAVPTLEVLRERLKEKQVEQNLYYPNSCRKYYSYFVCPNQNPIGPSRYSFSRDTTDRSFRVCRDSTNLPHQYTRSFVGNMDTGINGLIEEQENIDKRPDVARRESRQEDKPKMPNPRYSARYSRKTLENTNVSINEISTSLGAISTQEKIDTSDNYETSDRRMNTTENLLVHPTLTEHNDTAAGDNNSSFLNESSNQKTTVDLKGLSLEDQVDRPIIKHSLKKSLSNQDKQELESEKSYPWLKFHSNDKDLSRQMLLYLSHKELNRKIEDLAKRELHACNKHSWDEALRLRNMRNRLDFVREKKLYNAENLELDENTRELKLENIEKKAAKLAEREHVCTNSTMYSEEAKALWKKWVREDDTFATKDIDLEKETLVNKLETIWKNLTIQDKERMSRSFENVLNAS